MYRTFKSNRIILQIFVILCSSLEVFTANHEQSFGKYLHRTTSVIYLETIKCLLWVTCQSLQGSTYKTTYDEELLIIISDGYLTPP